MLRRAVSTSLRVIAGILVIGVTSSCSTIAGWFGDDDAVKTDSVSVFDAQVGDCFVAPADVKAQLADLTKVPCDSPHQQELYAVVEYQEDGSDKDDPYPGEGTLDTFAKGECAAAFGEYVGIAYPDSGMWMTYLLPSARSWQQGDDRSVQCFVTTTGEELTASVKGSKQ